MVDYTGIPFIILNAWDLADVLQVITGLLEEEEEEKKRHAFQ